MRGIGDQRQAAGQQAAHGLDHHEARGERQGALQLALVPAPGGYPLRASGVRVSGVRMTRWADSHRLV